MRGIQRANVVVKVYETRIKTRNYSGCQLFAACFQVYTSTLWHSLALAITHSLSCSVVRSFGNSHYPQLSSASIAVYTSTIDNRQSTSLTHENNQNPENLEHEPSITSHRCVIFQQLALSARDVSTR